MLRTAIAAVVCALAGCVETPEMMPPDSSGTDPTCSNGIKDGLETDVDCGGGTCRRCAGLRHCEAASDCFSGLCAADTNTCPALTTVAFANAVFYPSSYKPYVMLAGDLDADGDVDLAAGNELASTVTVFRNDGSGVFSSLAASTPDGFPTGEYPTGGAIADLNRDGIADIVTADYHGNSVSVLLGAGSQNTYTLTAGASYPTVPGAETSNLAVGDLNGDSITDVIATNPQMHSVSVFLGRGDGTLQPAVDLGLMGMAEPYSVAIGDFDGDGNNDAAIADNVTLTVYIELGNGDGTFTPAPARPQVDGQASFILLARDMDLDGKLDVVVANRNSEDVSVLLGHGDGTFADAVVSPAGPGGPYSLAVTDFNLDAVPDVVTANFMTGNASVLLGIGNGHFEAPIDAGGTGDFSYGVATGDFNSDGKPDFATANALSNDVAVKMSTA
ncbi:MAG TPA: VCBS repeat-containing protein, partial [Kofleriaceae bacterium]|nr:VCBS repeat-containing protein [Kofleriaceae bacterium]